MAILLQDAAFIEMHRRRIYSTQPVDQSESASAEPSTDTMPIAADDYQRMKQWKDAVGAGTFSQLNARLDRHVVGALPCLLCHLCAVKIECWA